MKSFQFNTTAGLRVGSGRATDTAPEVLSKLGKRILFITDPGLKKLGLIDKTIEALKTNSKIIIFDRVEADPSLKTLMSVVDVGKEFKATGVIGFGGGSSMDVAKLCALLLGSNEDIEEAWGVANAKGPRLPLVLYPTTAGTGSEVTPISIITVGGDEKKGVSSPVILPDLAILDPDLTIGLPSHITAATGIDAMVHAIEGYASKSINNNIMSKMLAKEALSILGRSIKKAVFEGTDINARTDMLLGSMMAGMAFGNSPVAGVHALAYPLGGTFHIPHGLSNSLVLPHVLRFNIADNNAAQLYAELAPRLFPEMDISSDNKETSIKFIDNLASLSKELGLEQKLRGLNIPEDACAKMASDAMKQSRLLINNPREITEKDAFDIYKLAW
ncbi:MAG: iron-containing alcohol dehydrogenase [Alphaproteobacteria bacterium]|nr:iron-containing alcohol dehydrogenase [Alphaproteobacteria bacterium]